MTEKALETIAGISCLDNEEVLDAYSQDLSFTRRIKPRYVVRPENTEQVQALVKWANETLTPLVPVSSGAPHFRGDTVPGTGGAVIVDLSGMKQILRVDRRNRVAMIEPGLTFGELIPALAKEGMRLNLPLLPRQTKSVIGSMLERDPVIMPLYQWDAIDPLLCTEIIFGTGDMFRTGSAAGPGTLEEQWASKQAQVNPMGPGQTDFARIVQGAQGTMGIITWATIKCEVLPAVQKPFVIGSDRLDKLTELIHQMMWLKMVNECLVLDTSGLAAMLARDAGEYGRMRDSLPPWILFYCIAGYNYYPEDRVAYQSQEVGKQAQRLGLDPAGNASGVSAYELMRLLGAPSEEPYWKLCYKGSCQDIFFLTTLDQVSGFISVMREVAEQHGYPATDIGTYIQPMVQGTSCHCEFNLFYDPANDREAAKVRELYTRAADALMRAGAFFSRPYGAIAEMAYRRDGETTAALRKVKTIFDPNNIMNPGKLCF